MQLFAALFYRCFLSIFIDYCAERTALTVEQLQSKDYAGDERRGADMTPVLLFVRA
ncbi:hypothetical protein PCI56_12540 [Plesiomonas shigelloides subsp. oncorhynchi]|nr:hypothetical protein [Plesiomonas shigelloides]